MLISALASQTLIYPRADLRVAPRPLSMGLSTTARRARFASRSLSMSGAKGGAATKFIVVTGGVISGIGKGVTASSIGVCMKMLGARVTAVKIDPYLNVDAGTDVASRPYHAYHAPLCSPALTPTLTPILTRTLT